MRKAIFILAILIFLYHRECYCQVDSIKNSITTNLASGIIFQEAGMYANIKCNNKSTLEFSYGHRFHSYTVIENGGSGGDYKIWKQTADIFRVGYKLYHHSRSIYGVDHPYNYYRLSYWDVKTPNYLVRYGSNGLGSTRREIISVEKKLINIGIGIGKSQQLDKHIWLDYFFIFGMSAGTKRIHQYSYGNNGTEFIYPPNTFERSFTVLPTFEIGFNLGYCW